MHDLETMSKPPQHELVIAKLTAMGNEQFSKSPTNIPRFSPIVLSMDLRGPWHLGGGFEKPPVESNLFAHRVFVRVEEPNLKYEKHQPLSDKVHELLPMYVNELLLDVSQQNRSAALRIREANREINELDDEMVADGLPQVTDAMKDEARRIVRALARQPATPTVYGTQDGDIAIQFDSEKSAVVIELNRVGGSAACFSHVGGKNQRARYDDSGDLPDEFVEAQLRRLISEL